MISDRAKAPVVARMTLEAVNILLFEDEGDVKSELVWIAEVARASAFRSASCSTNSWQVFPVRRNRETASLCVTLRTETPSISRIRSPS